jgi:hypothetical protein
MNKRRLLLAGLLILTLYFGSYAYLYSFRPLGAAANLAYFLYLRGPNSDSYEKCLYYFYYPIYKVHRCFGGQRHNLDRSQLPHIDNF